MLLNPLGAEFLNFVVKGSFTPKTGKMAFLGTLTGTLILGRLRSFSQLAEMPGMCLLLLRF